jgi:hypothetical protein
LSLQELNVELIAKFSRIKPSRKLKMSVDPVARTIKYRAA